MAENVRGLLNKKARGYVNEILKKFYEIGYETQVFLLNSAFMGVPQRRERVFFIAKIKNLNFPHLNLKFNEKPIKYGEIKDSNYTPNGRAFLDIFCLGMNIYGFLKWSKEEKLNGAKLKRSSTRSFKDCRKTWC